MPRHRPVTHVNQLQRGDHVRVRRIGYQHHAIYVGDHQLIEFGGGVSGGPVAYVTMDEFARNDRVEIVEHDHAFPSDLVAVRAEQQIGLRDFSLWKNNCEHFATWCATGQARSRQVDNVKAAATLAAVGLTVAALTQNSSSSRGGSPRS